MPDRPPKPIYLDYNATTPLDPRVLQAMAPYWTEKFGNPASGLHSYGFEAKAACDRARGQIAALIHAESPQEIIFTSGATEASNLAIKGVLSGSFIEPPHLITQKTEHKCVIEVAKNLQKSGTSVSYLEVDSRGQIDLDHLSDALTDHTVLVSIMSANNETGTVMPMGEISKLVHARPGALLHSDAAQALGKISVDVGRDGIDLLSLSAHKVYGPKGVGALYIKKRRPPIGMQPLIEGGGHERGFRSGTLPVPLIVGFGEAAAIAARELKEDAARMRGLSERFLSLIREQLSGVSLNGDPVARLPNTLNLSFEGVRADALVLAMGDLAVSSGSACASNSPEPSYVLAALGKDPEIVQSAIRFSLGRFTRPEEVDFAAESVVKTVTRLRRTHGSR